MGSLKECQESLVKFLSELETTMRPLNAEVIGAMADKLKTVASKQ
jgi:hypothetical protein